MLHLEDQEYGRMASRRDKASGLERVVMVAWERGLRGQVKTSVTFAVV